MDIKRTVALLAAAGIAAVSITATAVAETSTSSGIEATVTSSGTYKVSAGTGRYARIRGHGTYSLTAYAIVKKVKGKCATNVVPYAQTELLTATGPLTG